MRLLSSLVIGTALLAGCPRTAAPPESSGSVTDDRPADLGLSAKELARLRERLGARLDALRESDPAGAGVVRIEGALELIDSLQAISASREPGREQERAALAAAAAWLEQLPDLEPDPMVPEELGGVWTQAVAAYADGELGEAVELGLSALRELVDTGLDSATMRYRLAEWAMERGDGELAAELFDGALAVQSGQGWIAEEAPLQAARARNLELGPDGAALAEAQGLVDQGRWAEADDVLRDLLANGSDREVLERAEALAAEVDREASDEALRKLARADQILAGAGPYESVRGLLDEVAALPAGTWDEAEKLRLEGWFRNRVGASTASERIAQEEEQAATLQDARDLVIAGEFRAALKAYARLDGTPLRATARKEAREAAETLVRQERERAGEMFVAARKLRDPAAKREALGEVQRILGGLIEEFPDSAYVERLRTNLRAVNDELRSI